MLTLGSSLEAQGQALPIDSHEESNYSHGNREATGEIPQCRLSFALRFGMNLPRAYRLLVLTLLIVFNAGIVHSKETSEKAALVNLGERLFFDLQFSADGKTSCRTCHQPEHAFQDGLTVARGVGGVIGTRNTPSLFNVGNQLHLFWDGRSESLEAQARIPFVTKKEHGLPSLDVVVATMRKDAKYVAQFFRAFRVSRDSIEIKHVVGALAAFQRTLISLPSPFERYLATGDAKDVSEAAKRGFIVFRGVAGCSNCHVISDRALQLTDHEFHGVALVSTELGSKLAALVTRVNKMTMEEISLAIPEDTDLASLGRFLVTKNPKDIGKFKTPSLINVAVTAPYMHDGSVATLSEAIDREIYYRGAELNRPIVLTVEEKRDLQAFMESLTTPPWQPTQNK